MALIFYGDDGLKEITHGKDRNAVYLTISKHVFLGHQLLST
jgi:hypothetical protein